MRSGGVDILLVNLRTCRYVLSVRVEMRDFLVQWDLGCLLGSVVKGSWGRVAISTILGSLQLDMGGFWVQLVGGHLGGPFGGS